MPENKSEKVSATRSDLNQKIESEAKKVFNSASSEDLSNFHSEVEIKYKIRNELYNMFMSDEMIQALWTKDNTLDDVYRFYVDENKDNQVFLALFEYLEKAEHEYIDGMLYDRIKAEYETRLEEIRKMPPNEIIEKAYELVMLEDIRIAFECDNELDTEQVKALLSLESPLWSVYHDWKKSDFSQMDDIRYVINETANETASEMGENSYEPDNDLENEDGQEL